LTGQGILPESNPKTWTQGGTKNKGTTIVLYKSDRFDRSASKIGGKSLEPVIRSAIEQFIADKIKKIRDLESQGKPITTMDLDLGKYDRGKMDKYYHYHLRIGEQTGKVVLFYEQIIDNNTKTVSFYLTIIVPHTAYLTKATQKQMMANMPTGYNQVGTLGESKIRVPEKRSLFSWLKKPPSS